MKDFKKKWENYWYHNKGKTIIGLLLAVILCVTIVESVTKENYDMKVYVYVSEDLSDTTLRAFEDTLESYYKDEEKLNIEVISYSYDPYTADSESVSAKASAFMAEISLRSDFLIITDDYRFDDINENEAFNNLFEKHDFFAEKNSLAMSLKSTKFEQKLKENLANNGVTGVNVPELYLSLIDAPQKDQESYENYEKSLDLAKRIVNAQK